jgi:hypothetical protein
MLLLRDFFRPPLPAKELATSTVIFSLSIFLRTGDWPVDLRDRRVEGTVASILSICRCDSDAKGGATLVQLKEHMFKAICTDPGHENRKRA